MSYSDKPATKTKKELLEEDVSKKQTEIELLKQQFEAQKNLLKEKVDKLVDLIINTKIKTDAVNYLIKALENLTAHQNKKTGNHTKVNKKYGKRVEKGTDWDKKIAELEKQNAGKDTGMDLKTLKEVFKNL